MLNTIKRKIILIIKIVILFIISFLMILEKTSDIKMNIVYDITKTKYLKTEKFSLMDIEELAIKEVTSFSEVLTYAKTTSVTFEGTMTGYGPDCKGCSGIVACSPYQNVENGNIYFNDDEFGKVRILAADSKIPCGTIVKISNLKNYEEFYAIVLDRGGVIKKTLFDLLFTNEKETFFFGRNTSTYTIVRWGW